MVTAQMVKELREKTGAGMLDCKKALDATDGDIEASITWLREKGIAKAAKKEDRIAAEGLCGALEKGNEVIVYEVNSETDFVAKNDKFLALVDLVGNAIANSNAKNTNEALAINLDGKTLDVILAEATATIGEKITLRRVSRIAKNDSQVFGVYKHQGGRIVTVVTTNGTDSSVARDIAMHVTANSPRYLNQAMISDDVIAQEKEILMQEALNEGKPREIVEKMVTGRLNKYLKEICLVNQPFVKNPDVTVEQFAKSNNSTIVNYVRMEVGEGIEKAVVDFASEVAAQMKA